MHEALEGGGGVGEAKGHDSVLKVAITGAKRSFWYVVGVDADLVVAVAQVNLGKNGGPMETVEEFVNTREWVAVFYGNIVEGTVVDAKAEGAILLADKKNRSAEGGGARADVSTREEGDELAFELGELLLGHGVYGAVGGGGAWDEFDLVVDGPHGGKRDLGGGGREGGGELGEEGVKPSG